MGDKAHVMEQNIGAEYSVIKDKLLIRAIYDVQYDKESVAKQTMIRTDFSLWLYKAFSLIYI